MVSSVTTPAKVPRRFTKIDLDRGATRTVTFVLKSQGIELLDGNMNWVVEPSLFEVIAAG